MKKSLILAIGFATLVSSCGSYAGAGAATGGYFGSILGSAIGGISGGPRGSDVGTLIGMVGGAMVGAAVGSAADNAQRSQYSNRPQYNERSYDSNDDYVDFSNSGDDRIEFEGAAVTMPDVELRNVHFRDANGDGMISAGEECKVSFEVVNHSKVSLRDVYPTVAEITRNKHIHISPALRVEDILPGKGVRYTATVYGDSRLKNGEIVLNVSATQNNRNIATGAQSLRIKTQRR